MTISRKLREKRSNEEIAALRKALDKEAPKKARRGKKE